MSLDDEILQNITNSNKNSLVEIYEQTLTETDEEPQLLQNSPYISSSKLKETLLSKK